MAAVISVIAIGEGDQVAIQALTILRRKCVEGLEHARTAYAETALQGTVCVLQRCNARAKIYCNMLENGTLASLHEKLPQRPHHQAHIVPAEAEAVG